MGQRFSRDARKSSRTQSKRSSKAIDLMKYSSIFDISVPSNVVEGEVISLSQYRGQAAYLVVNVASQ